MFRSLSVRGHTFDLLYVTLKFLSDDGRKLFLQHFVPVLCGSTPIQLVENFDRFI